MSTERQADATRDGYDLHLHSIHSDGVLTPAAVVDLAARGEVKAFALTDHDTTAGLVEAKQRARELGLHCIAGVELSATWHGQTVHVLGFDFDPQSPALVRQLAEVRELRRARMHEIARRLERRLVPAGVLVEQIEAKHPVMTRTHLARALVASGAARSLGEVFRRMLGRGAPGHLASNYPTVESAVQCLREAGGHAVLAHPMRYTLSAGARRRLLQEFRDAGGTGMEVVCGNARAHVDGLAQLAQRFGLDGSVGSDFHDPELPWNPPGRLAKLPLSVSPVWRHFQLPA